MSKRGLVVNFGLMIFLIAVLVNAGNLSIAGEKSGTGEIKVLYEKRFDKKIDQVKIVRYEENGTVRFYPKVVVLKELDKDLSQKDWRFYRKEVLVLDKEGNITARIPDLEYFSEVRVSINGILVAVLRRYLDKPSPYRPGLMEDWKREKKQELTVYNDRGKIVWQTDKKLFAPKCDCHFGGISEKDTSISIAFDYGGGKKYSPTRGFWMSPFDEKYPSELVSGTLYGRFMAVAVYNRDGSRLVVLLDSTANPIWEKSIDEQTIGQVRISPHGSYVFVWAYTWSQEKDTKEEAIKRGRTLSKLVSVSTYLFDKEGNLILKKDDKCRYGSSVFSDNEKYLAYRIGTTPVMIITETGDYKKLPITLPTSTMTNPQMIISDNGILYIWYKGENEYELTVVNEQGDIKGKKVFTKDELSKGIENPGSSIMLVNGRLILRIVGEKTVRICELTRD
ncbi:hypothetical protein CH333_01935 [candidate division WOR-3 bacterium JGI_Cruoil_03_44_89]|uniref:Uncharacterized protein n=1 Tax=candidate division WOR-3 bacterium JGI_Cruoil_03_44_89 TaxID=1973748 RepID=A0A235BY26_UNCW3|nr:MAG: hypothetical protein CH333_01935 [candidate division WOR-3 bacterium JGI_Cruoil_03_44_89]